MKPKKRNDVFWYSLNTILIVALVVLLGNIVYGLGQDNATKFFLKEPIREYCRDKAERDGDVLQNFVYSFDFDENHVHVVCYNMETWNVERDLKGLRYDLDFVSPKKLLQDYWNGYNGS